MSRREVERELVIQTGATTELSTIQTPDLGVAVIQLLETYPTFEEGVKALKAVYPFAIVGEMLTEAFSLETAHAINQMKITDEN